MANKLYEESHIQDIANAIRLKNGTSSAYLVSQMGEAIRAIAGDDSGNEKFKSLLNRSITEISEDDLADLSTIEDHLFYNCTKLTNVTLPNHITSIGIQSFMICTSLKNITIPGSVTSIGNNAFDNCHQLTSIIIPYGVTTINRYTFHYCIKLANVVIPNSVTEIGPNAFQFCKKLPSITIPSSVTLIGNYAFDSCTILADINLYPTTPPVLSGNNSIPSTATIHVPVGCRNAYISSTNWANREAQIVEDL